MADVTIAQFADVLKVSVDRLIRQAEPTRHPSVRLSRLNHPATEVLSDLTTGGLSTPLPGV